MSDGELISEFDFYEPHADDLIVEIELGDRAADAIGAWHDWNNPRICRSCKRAIWPEQPDPCLGWLPGVEDACCGHGERRGFPSGYIAFEDGPVIRFDNCLVDDVHLVREVDEHGNISLQRARL